MIYVMSDIHGNRRRFDSIMAQIDLQPDDQLYVLGDVIDRHPDGIAILLQLMDMPNTSLLLGNHELMMYEALTTPVRFHPGDDQKKKRLWFSNGGKVTLDAFERLSSDDQYRVMKYIADLPYHKMIEVNEVHYRLVHAAPPELVKYSWYYNDPREFSVWARIDASMEMPEDCVVIFGHTPTAFYFEKDWFDANVPEEDRIMSIWHGNRRICIDCGSGFPNAFDHLYGANGRLACLRLDDMKEYYSKEKCDSL